MIGPGRLSKVEGVVLPAFRKENCSLKTYIFVGFKTGDIGLIRFTKALDAAPRNPVRYLFNVIG
jgi:hypothetical protein